MEYETGLSARAQLIKSRRGAWVDESLFPEARRECIEMIERVARESREDGIVEMLRGNTKHLEKYPLGVHHKKRQEALPSYFYRSTRTELHEAALDLLTEKLRDQGCPNELQEEHEARIAAAEAPRFTKKCGSCARSLRPEEPLHFGAEVYVGFPLLRWSWLNEPQVCQPRYQRTVLCGFCAPEWLSAEKEGVVTQLCAQCERPMVYRMMPSEMRRSFCSEPCGQTYHGQLRKEQRAEERKKVCEVCEREFTARRKDAKTCSSGCKQKAYRLRKERK